MRSSSYTGSCSERPRSPDGSGVNREVHAPFCERPGVKLLRPTHPSANTKMVRLYGRCARGERLVDLEPHGHWKTITFVAALRQNGMTAPCTIDGAMNGGRFLTYVERCLAPTLQAQRHRDARQSSGAQGRRCPRGHRSARGNASIPAQIFPRPEPDRDVLQPDEGRSAQGGRAHNSSPPPPDQVIRSDRHPSPSRQLFQARRLCVKSIGICSNVELTAGYSL